MRLYARLLWLGLAAVAVVSCHRRAPGTCLEDIDCAPGFDCRAATCVRRERLYARPAPPDPQAAPTPAPAEAPAQPPDPPGAAADPTLSPYPDAGAPSPKTKRTVPAPATPAAPPPPPSPGHEPLWKQRLKNS